MSFINVHNYCFKVELQNLKYWKTSLLLNTILWRR